MNRKYILIGLLVCITGIFSGCHSWLDVQPEDQVTDGQLFSTESGFRTALNGIYVELSNNALYGGESVSYTHLDVYKRQVYRLLSISDFFCFILCGRQNYS